MDCCKQGEKTEVSCGTGLYLAIWIFLTINTALQKQVWWTICTKNCLLFYFKVKTPYKAAHVIQGGRRDKIHCSSLEGFSFIAHENRYFTS